MGGQTRSSVYGGLLGLCLLAAVAWCCGRWSPAETEADAHRAVDVPARDVSEADLIVVDQGEPWMAALAAPLAAHTRHQGHVPLLLAADYPPSARASWLVEQACPQHVVVLSADEDPRLGPALPGCKPEVLPLGVDPVAASLALAKRYWHKTPQAVVAASDDLEGVVRGSALAAELSLPLLIRDGKESRTHLLRALRELGVERLVAAVVDPRHTPHWAAADPRVDVMSANAIDKFLLTRFGPANVRNVILARVPDPTHEAGPTTWLAPYISLVRRAPLVLCHPSDAEAAETQTFDFIAQHGLRPRTVTILADYESIGSRRVEVEAGEAEADELPTPTPPTSAATPTAASGTAAAPKEPVKYEVQREPCVRFHSAHAIPLGVGRIPFESLAEASGMFARGMLRERSFGRGLGHVLLVANPSIDRRPLPLCETISRVTGQEFKNCQVPIDEFYGVLGDKPEVLAAIPRANLYIYEGHVSYQDTIYVPYGRLHVPDEYYEEAVDALEKWIAETHPEPKPGTKPEPKPESKPDVLALPPARAPSGPDKPLRLERRLATLPVAVLQSCESLDEKLLDTIDDLGCTAVIGSFTNIHSGSGSMLVQAFSESILYRGSNLGEALRDAQNFLYCLGDLKSLRGMKEQAKSRRVAISFRLWGDPELPLELAPTQRPVTPPVNCQWTAPGQLTIRLPANRFPEVTSAKYSAEMFPGSNSAGLVTKKEGATLRRVLPSYYFRLPIPPDFPAETNAIEAPDGDRTQAAFRVDPLGRFLCVCYLPDAERPLQSVVLKFIKATPSEKTPVSKPKKHPAAKATAG